jgi:hypothetical protein
LPESGRKDPLFEGIDDHVNVFHLHFDLRNISYEDAWQKTILKIIDKFASSGIVIFGIVFAKLNRGIKD